MHPIAEFAEGALRKHPDPALRLGELVDLVAERFDRTLNAARLRGILEGYPDRFRILDPWSGRWRCYEGTATARDRTLDVWVIGIGESDPPPATAVVVKLRESVRWLARGVDPRSATDIGRWYTIALAGRSLRRGSERRAA